MTPAVFLLKECGGNFLDNKLNIFLAALILLVFHKFAFGVVRPCGYKRKLGNFFLFSPVRFIVYIPGGDCEDPFRGKASCSGQDELPACRVCVEWPKHQRLKHATFGFQLSLWLFHWQLLFIAEKEFHTPWTSEIYCQLFVAGLQEMHVHIQHQNVLLPCIVDLSASGMLVEFLVGHPEHGVCALKKVLVQLWFLTRDSGCAVLTQHLCELHLAGQAPPLLFAPPGAQRCARSRVMLKALCPPSQPQAASAPHTAIKQRLLGSSNPSALFLIHRTDVAVSWVIFKFPRENRGEKITVILISLLQIKQKTYEQTIMWIARRVCMYSRGHCAALELLRGEKDGAVGKLTNQLATPGMNRGKAKGQGGDPELRHGRGGCEWHRRCDSLAGHDATPPGRAALPDSQQRSSRADEGPGEAQAGAIPQSPGWPGLPGRSSGHRAGAGQAVLLLSGWDHGCSQPCDTRQGRSLGTRHGKHRARASLREEPG
ncbi:hypothetical protein EK904_013820 [Melospiza melodia maxima]|nr:hypothetical protein EK904_013820 [Melospiza melodia maxima]